MAVPNLDWKVALSDWTGTQLGTNANPLVTSIAGGGGGGTSAVDEVAWTAGVSGFNPGGGAFNDSAAALTSGQQGTQRVTPNRALHINLRNQAGTEMGTAGNPLFTTVSGGGSATSAADAAAWTAGASLFNPAGGVFNDAAAALTAGQQGTQRLTPNRGLHVNLRSQNGTELLPVPAALADATANPTLSELQTFPMSWDQTNSKWNRVLGTQPFLTGVTPSSGAAGLLGAASVVYNATADTLVVQRSLASLADGIAGGTTVGMGAYAWNAATWDRLRTVTAATGTTGTGVLAAGPVLFDSVGGTNYVKQAGDGSGRAFANLFGTVSTNNSSTATLTLGSVFTGTGDDVSGYAEIQVQIFSDQASAAGGFTVQYSQNNSNWDVVDTQADVVASTGRSQSFKPRGRFFRIVYTNGGVNQTAFRLQTVYHQTPLAAGLEVARAQNTLGAGVLAAGVTGKSCAYGSSPTAVTSGNFAQACADVLGLPFSIGGSPAAITLRATFSAAQTDTALVTIASGNKIVVTSFMITVDNATTPNVAARLGFGTVNTPTTTGVLGSHPGIAPGSGFGRGNGGGIIGAGADDADLRFTCSVPTNGNVDVNVSYYVVPV